jgi:hypothetical protein
VSAIARRLSVAHDICNTAMQFVKVKLTHSFFYNYLFYAQLISVHADKRYVFSLNLHSYFLFVASNQRALTPAVRQFFFANAAHVLIMFWHYFG